MLRDVPARNYDLEWQIRIFFQYFSTTLENIRFPKMMLKSEGAQERKNSSVIHQYITDEYLQRLGNNEWHYAPEIFQKI